MARTAEETAPITTCGTTKTDLSRALRTVSAAGGKQVRLTVDADALTITGSGPGLGAQVTLDLDSAHRERAEVTLSRVTLAKVLAVCGPAVELGVVGHADKPQLLVKSADAEFRFPGERPDIPARDHVPLTSGRDATIDAATLVEVLRRALTHASTDWSRPIIRCVALYPESALAVATDSYRLCVLKYGDAPDDKSEEPMLIPYDLGRSLVQIIGRRLGDVSFSAVDGQIQARFGDTSWSAATEMPRGEKPSGFPSWRQLLPDSPADGGLSVDRVELLAAARSAEVVAGNGPLRLQGDTVRAGNDLNGTMARVLRTAIVREPTGTIGGAYEFGLNPTFVAALCASASDDRLDVELRGPLRPALVECGRDRFILMPIRLNV